MLYLVLGCAIIAITYTLYSLAICNIRLDFEQFSTRGPTGSEQAANDHPCLDVLQISSTTVCISMICNHFVPKIIIPSQLQNCYV